MTGPVLRFDAVQKRFGHPIILDDIHLAVAAGETVALLGPNGAGKSTLLHLAAGLLRPTKGKVQVHGHPAGSDEARPRVALVPQDPALYHELTPLEHLRWWARLHRHHGLVGDPSNQGTDTLHDQLRGAGLLAHSHRPTGTLSRGQRQRLAIAMALLPDPNLLLLDEPYTALDAEGAAWLDAILAARRGRGTTVIALHDPERAELLADRLLRVEARRVVAADRSAGGSTGSARAAAAHQGHADQGSAHSTGPEADP